MSAVAFYARVSTSEQNADTQLVELRKHRAWSTPPAEFVDHISGSRRDRPALTDLMQRCKAGQFKAIYTTRVSRFGRSLAHQIALVKELSELGVAIHFIKDGLSTSDDSPVGRFVVRLFGLIGEWELDSLSEQTREGMARARAAGTRLGRPSAKIDWVAVDAMRANGLSWARICETIGIGRTTMTRARRKRRESGNDPG